MTDRPTIDSIAKAVSVVADVRAVDAVLEATSDDGRPVVGIRIGLPPTLTLPQVVRALARVQGAATRVLPTARVFVEPRLASEDPTPTEAIVIRASE